MDSERFHHVRRVEAGLAEGPWPYAEREAAAIAQAWRRWRAENPALFDGRVLILAEGHRDGAVFRGRYREVNFSAFLHFMRLGAPDGTSRNGFALAALTAADGALVMGVMGGHTANAGKIYFPGGTPDPGDVAGGQVDLAGSVLRELAEETGLGPDEVEVDDGFWLYEDDKRAAFMKIVRSPLPGEALRAQILERLSRQACPELAGLHLVRAPDDLRPDLMPAFQLAYARWWLARGGAHPAG